MSKERESANLVSTLTGVAVTITGDPIALGVGNTEHVRVTGGGNVSIGVTDNPQTKLHVDGTSNSNARITISRSAFLRNNYIGLDDDADELAIAADENNEGPDSHIIFKVDGSEKLRVTGDGFVGIGSTNPGQKLAVQDNAPSGTSNVFISNTGGDGVIYLLNNDQYSAGLGTLADNGSYIEFSGKDNSTNTAANKTFGRIGAFKENNTSDSQTGYLSLYTRPSSGGLAERVRIVSNGRIGIGTVTPKGGNDIIHIFNNSSGDAYINFEGSIPRVNRIGCDDHDNISISADEDNQGTSSYVRIKVDGSEKARFIANGGLTFNGDSADANALDDYEEGTWTPQVTQGVSGTPTYQFQIGWYTKIGRLVTLYFYLRFASTGNTGDNTRFRVGNFPFPIISTGSNTTYHRGMGVTNYHSIPGFTSANIAFYGGGTSNTFADVYQGSTSVATSSAVNSDYIIGGFEYFT